MRCQTACAASLWNDFVPCLHCLKPFTCSKRVLFLAQWVVRAFDVRLFSPAKTDRSFKEFLDARNPTKQHSSTLESYLIKPVQRVLKYPLLLRELVSLTDTDSEEHYHLTGASHTAAVSFAYCLDQGWATRSWRAGAQHSLAF